MNKYNKLKEKIVEGKIKEGIIDIEEFEGIAREQINLEDVLFALGKQNSDYSISSTGNFMIYEEDAGMYNMYKIFWDIKWIFNKPLKDQPKETIDFLYKILNI
jgi:hypothetical protein